MSKEVRNTNVNKFNPTDAKVFIEASNEIRTVIFLQAEHQVVPATPTDPEKHKIVFDVMEDNMRVSWTDGTCLLKAADKDGNRMINPVWVGATFYAILQQTGTPIPSEAFDLDDAAEILTNEVAGKELKLIAYRKKELNVETKKIEESKFITVELNPNKFDYILKKNK